jgi:hypothetical protein
VRAFAFDIRLQIRQRRIEATGVTCHRAPLAAAGRKWPERKVYAEAAAV